MGALTQDGVVVQSAQQGGNATNVATLAAAAGKTTYLSGIHYVVGGATAGVAAVLTIAGLLGGSMVIPVEAQTGVAAGPTIGTIAFNPPIPASALNTAITATLGPLGLGNTTAGIAAWGFQL